MINSSANFNDYNFTISDVHQLLDFIGDRAIDSEYEEDLHNLDLSIAAQARYAIRSWITPIYLRTWASNATALNRLKVAMTVALSRWGFLPHGPFLPGIDDLPPSPDDPGRIYALWRQFYILVWDEIFHESFNPIVTTDNLVERIDMDFVNYPTNPELWGAPKYRSLTYWDDILRSTTWRNDWPPAHHSRINGRPL